MSYLAQPRIHFSGSFQADVSTVNNSVLRYDSANFHPAWQKRGKGNWNPDGSGSFRLIDCRVTGAQLDGHHLTRAGQDPVIGAVISGADGRVAGKLVDLDPQQQSVSEIWGLQMRLTDRRGNDLFGGDYKVAPFMDLWKRQQTSEPGDQTLASFYQSVLQKVDWYAIESSPVLHALREVSQEGLLSIRFNVFGFDRNPKSDTFTMGRVVGTIGPAGADEPDHFVFGRHLWPDLQKDEKSGELSPVQPKQGVYGFCAQVDRRRLRLSVDLGNALPIVASQGQLEDIGELLMAVLPDESIDNGAFLKDSELALIGSVDYRSPRWYERTAGVVDFEYSGCEEARKLIDRHPLALVKAVPDGYQVLVRETRDGLYVRTDRFVQRLNPSDSTPMTVYASQYGRPLRARIDLAPYNKQICGGADHEKGKPPQVGVPESALKYPSALHTDANGRATFSLVATDSGPGNPRGYIDGQVYGLACRFAEAPEAYQYDPWAFVSVLVWDAYYLPEHPTWVEHIEPILKQYGILYPIMSHYLVDLGNYESVKKHLEILRLAFSLPVSNPNYMPVTRDLSDRKRATLLRWIDQGAPFGEGEPAPAAPEESGGEHLADDMGGKTEFLNSLSAGRE